MKHGGNSPASAPDHRQLPFAPTHLSDCINLVIHISVCAMDFGGKPFFAAGRTLTVSRCGATIVQNHPLATDQEISIRCSSSRDEASARVLAPIGERDGEFVYAIALLAETANPWGIQFPPLSGAEDTLARTVLQCTTCPDREVVHLNEIEFQVFEVNHCIPRFCRRCSATTDWKLATFPNAELVSSEGVEPDPARGEMQKLTKKRKYDRVQTKVSACIRRPGCADEIVRCDNYSRGGLRFASPTHYREGTRVEVALPYSTTGNGNIFVQSRIVHVQQVGDKFRVGLAYVRTYDEEH